ncbi:biotin/lipoyl-binding protein (plasmid) [Pseudoalteromonas espejiana]
MHWPRVSGIIDSIEFKEGDVVKQGDVLFQLDGVHLQRLLQA